MSATDSAEPMWPTFARFDCWGTRRRSWFPLIVHVVARSRSDRTGSSPAPGEAGCATPAPVVAAALTSCTPTRRASRNRRDRARRRGTRRRRARRPADVAARVAGPGDDATVVAGRHHVLFDVPRHRVAVDLVVRSEERRVGEVVSGMWWG